MAYRLARHIRFAPVLLALWLALLMVGCDGSGCLDNGSSIPKALFYTAEGQQAQIASLTAYGIGAPGDSMLTQSETVSQLYLPLQVSVMTTRFVLNYNSESVDNDTLTLNYEPIRYFASKDCGAMYNFRINAFNYTRHAIDSIAMPDSLITNIDKEYIKIFMQ